jgi:hypothetical protein
VREREREREGERERGRTVKIRSEAVLASTWPLGLCFSRMLVNRHASWSAYCVGIVAYDITALLNITFWWGGGA